MRKVWSIFDTRYFFSVFIVHFAYMLHDTISGTEYVLGSMYANIMIISQAWSMLHNNNITGSGHKKSLECI